jgi:hypothetical protein
MSHNVIDLLDRTRRRLHYRGGKAAYRLCAKPESLITGDRSTMSGPEVHHLWQDPIQGLRRILRDQYDVGSILKEMLQNADDAKADELHFAIVNNWPGDTHPLLTGPTLLVLNDGEFEGADIEGIKRMDQGAKGADDSAIGRYGLGMKSLFHLCEGLFYAASENQPGAGDSPLVHLLNPWPRGGRRDEWDQVEGAKAAILQKVQDWRHGRSRWFCLVVPLRAPEHSPDGLSITQDVPTPEQVAERFDLLELAEFLPLLRSVKTIAVWAEQGTSDLVEVARSAPDGEVRQRAYGSDSRSLQLGDIHRLWFSASRRTAEGVLPLLEAAGVERLLDDDALKAIKNDSRWPQSNTWDSERQATQTLPEKASQHCAVVFSRTPGRRGPLTLTDAVYLPLSQGQFAHAELQGTSSIKAALHGQYFVDAGRNHLYKSASADTPQDRWNQELRHRGVLPLVPAALDEFARSSSLSYSDIADLTRALSETTFYQDEKPSICRTHQWLSVTSVDLVEPNWELVVADRAFLPFPRMTGRQGAVSALFPGISELTSEALLVEHDAPRLSARTETGWKGHDDLLERLFSAMDPKAVLHEGCLGFLADLLEAVGDDLGPSARATLVVRLSDAVAHHGAKKLAEHSEEVRRVVDALPHGSWVSLDLGVDSTAAYRSLNRLKLGVVVFPHDVAPPSDRALALDRAPAAFAWLTEQAEDTKAERTGSIALALLAVTAGSRSEQRTALGDHPVWLVRGFQADGTNPVLVSWSRIADLHDARRLFEGNSPFIKPLQRALAGSDVFSLFKSKRHEPFQLLLGEVEPPRCDGRACLSILGADPAPPLTAPKHRGHLLKQLRNAIHGNGDARAPIRYVLHGNAETWRDDTTPLFAGDPGATSHLSWATEQALTHLGSGWRWTPPDLAGILNPKEREWLGIEPVARGPLEKLLTESGVDWMRVHPDSDKHAASLLADIREPELWRDLPLHRLRDGSACSLTELSEVGLEAFLAVGDYKAPARIEGTAHVLVDQGSKHLAERYRSAGIQPWGAEGAIVSAMGSDEPGRLAVDVLEVLQNHQGPLTAATLGKLRSTSWLITRSGSSVRPSDMIIIEEMDSVIATILDEPSVRGTFAALADLASPVRTHPAVARLRSLKVLPDRNASLEVLGMCLSELTNYRVGADAEDLTPVDFMRLVRHAFVGVREPTLPVVPLLNDLWSAFRDRRDSMAQVVMPHIGGALPLDLRATTVNVLTRASTGDEGSNPAQHSRFQLLGLIIQQMFHDGHENELRGLDLPNALTQAVPSASLCVLQEGIASTHRLHPELAPYVPENRPEQPPPEPAAVDTRGDAEDDAEDDPGILIEHLRKWDGLVPSAHRGALLALFGDDPVIQREAGSLLAPHSVKGARNTLEWTKELIDPGRDDEAVSEAMANQSFVFRIREDGQPEVVQNLFGDWFQAPVGGAVESLFVGSLWPTPPERYWREDVRVKLVTLRTSDPSSLTRAQRSDVLRRSARLLLDEVYRQKPGNFAAWWDDLGQSGQLALEIAQEQIVRDAWFYFQQLGERRLPSLRELIRRHEELSDQEIELSRSDTETAEATRQEVIAELSQLPARLKTLLEQDESVQSETLCSVRDKMSDYQYSARSVPFELFQNSDDALSERIQLGGDGAAREIEFHLDDEHFIVKHWGRLINDFGADEDGRRKGYDKDLKRMLVLAASDKSEREELVTGKFGLGFKSVYFLTDEPSVVSGDLAFRVLGGFYPAQLNPETTRRITPGKRAGQSGTTIALPLTGEAFSEANAAVKAIEALIPVLLVTARSIKRASVVRDGDLSVNELESQEIVPGVFSHRLRSGASSGPLAHSGLLSLSVKQEAALVFMIGPNGVASFPGEVPDYWVRMPTGGLSETGMVLQGSFDLDVGRNQLAHNHENEVRAAERGRDLGDMLIRLWDETDDWPRVRDLLRLDADATRGQFWSSMWELTSSPKVQSSGLMKIALWTGDAPMTRLIHERAALPTGLPPLEDECVALSEVQVQVEGILDRRDAPPKLVQIAREVGGDRSALVSGRVVSRLKALGVDVAALQTLKLQQVVHVGLTDAGVVEPEAAAQLGALITGELLLEWQYSSDNAEAREFVGFLRSLQFRNQAGQPAASDELIALAGDDEELAGGFAPVERLLHEEYCPSGISFFTLCRGDVRHSVETLSSWAAAAVDSTKRSAVLHYLLNGPQRRSLANHLRARSTWLDDEGDPALKALTPQELVEFRVLMHGADPFEPEIEFEPAGIFRPDSSLEAIADWWESERHEHLARLESQTYPSGIALDLSANAPEDDAGRVEWLKLFLLGSLQSIGWTSPERNKNFLALCADQGWLAAFARADREPTAWVDRLIEHIDAQDAHIDNFQHLKHLFGLGIVSRYLDEYIEAFLATDLIHEEFDLRAITAPRTSAFFQGGGPDAPPLDQILGIGQCFVLRELMRSKVLTNEHTYRHCYVPFERTRRLITELGGPSLQVGTGSRWQFSSRIHGFLHEYLGAEASFNQSFDIPLMILAEDPELRSEVLGE